MEENGELEHHTDGGASIFAVKKRARDEHAMALHGIALHDIASAEWRLSCRKR